MRFTTSTGSRSTDGIASGSWLIATLPELYSIRSRGSSEASCAMRGSVSSGWPASLWRIANGFSGKSRRSALVRRRYHRRDFGDGIHERFLPDGFPAIADEMNGAARRLADAVAATPIAAWISDDDGIVAAQRNQHVADRKASAPDRIDHGMIGAGGGVGHRDRRIGAQVPGQVERQLHAGRKFREALVDAELEIERAILMPQHDGGGDRRVAGAQRHDFALAAFGERHGGAADKAGVAVVLRQRGAALGLPAAGLQRQEILDRARDLVRSFAPPRNATAPCSARRLRWRRSSFSFLAPSASRSNSSASRVASRQARAWDCSRRGRMPPCCSTSVKAFMAAPSSATSRRISAWAPACAPAASAGRPPRRPSRDRAAACKACRRDRR